MKKFIILLTVSLVFIASFIVWFNNDLSSVNKNDKSKKTFIIRKGESIREISSSLKQKGLIKDPIVFFLLVKKLNLENKIQAGDFSLSPSMTSEEIAIALTKGTIDVWITIPEGKRAEEISEILEISIASYKKNWASELKKYEGYLFPDTYLIPKDTNINVITAILKNNFEEKFQKLKIKNTNYSKDEIVIIASLIEREAKFDKDRLIIASVIYNRLNIGMPLQIDATIQYALGYSKKEKKWWRKEITFDDLKIKSLYNTYENIGLPPFPISNPGLSSLNAALNPAQTNYIYYLSDKNGVNHYAKTLTEHQANIRKFGL